MVLGLQAIRRRGDAGESWTRCSDLRDLTTERAVGAVPVEGASITFFTVRFLHNAVAPVGDQGAIGIAAAVAANVFGRGVVALFTPITVDHSVTTVAGLLTGGLAIAAGWILGVVGGVERIVAGLMGRGDHPVTTTWAQGASCPASSVGIRVTGGHVFCARVTDFVSSADAIAADRRAHALGVGEAREGEAVVRTESVVFVDGFLISRKSGFLRRTEPSFRASPRGLSTQGF